ncbi:retrovirus-related pol polyprotein from transposon TNT 1-94 [Tanacetum coccineum]|uniref:Retrovirus-related pol polyprotein from transposon TNT 1-94 n=1 Tax=Tanacetum coccineum TaxID=301880 RepID=A0ABQ5EMJ0_9ASTR
MDSDKYLEGQYMQRPSLFESDCFIYWKNRFETYVKAKDLDLWHIILNGDFPPVAKNEVTQILEVVPFEQQDDDLKRKLAKNNEAKMVLYNTLPKKEDLHPKWRAKVTAIEKSKDLSSLALDELIGNLKVHEVVMEKDSEIYRGKKERVKSIALKTKKESSDDETLTSESDDEEYAMAVRNFKKFFRRNGKFVRQPREEMKSFRQRDEKKGNNQKAFIGVSWSDSENEAEDKTNDETYLMAQSSNEVTLESSHYSDNDSSLDDDRNGIRKNGLHKMKLGNKSQDKLCLAAVVDNSTLWHRRLSHVNMYLIQSLSSKDLVRNLPKLKYDEHFCDACKIGKQAHASQKARNMVSNKKCLELLHMDLFGPSSIKSYEGNLYTLVIVDDYSRYTWTKFLKTKNEAFKKFEILSRKIQNQLGSSIVAIRPDHGREFDNDVQFRAYCDAQGITHNFSTPQPKNANEALGDDSWVIAMQKELNQFIANDVWDLVPLPKSHAVIGTKWVYRNKLDENGTVCRNKARLVAQGYNQQEGIDYDETYALIKDEDLRESYLTRENHLFHEERFVTSSFIEANNMLPTFQAVDLAYFSLLMNLFAVDL